MQCKEIENNVSNIPFLQGSRSYTHAEGVVILARFLVPGGGVGEGEAFNGEASQPDGTTRVPADIYIYIYI